MTNSSVEVEVASRKVRFHHVTLSELKDIRTTGFLTNLFIALTSIFASGLVAVLVALTYESVEEVTIKALELLAWVFAILTFLFLALVIIFFWLSHKSIKAVVNKGILVDKSETEAAREMAIKQLTEATKK